MGVIKCVWVGERVWQWMKVSVSVHVSMCGCEKRVWQWMKVSVSVHVSMCGCEIVSVYGCTSVCGCG